MGDYLAYATYSFSIGSSPYFSSTVYTRYLEKSIFPDEKLLAGFEQMKIKFTSKEEEGFTLQFSKTLLSVGTLTYGLYQVCESEYEKGEIIQITYDSFFVWKRGTKSLVFKMQPINFNDT